MKNYSSPRARLRLEGPYTTLAEAALHQKLVESPPTTYSFQTRQPKPARLRAIREAA